MHRYLLSDGAFVDEVLYGQLESLYAVCLQPLCGTLALSMDRLHGTRTLATQTQHIVVGI